MKTYKNIIGIDRREIEEALEAATAAGDDWLIARCEIALDDGRGLALDLAREATAVIKHMRDVGDLRADRAWNYGVTSAHAPYGVRPVAREPRRAGVVYR